MLQREIVLVLGQTGSGKTTWARKYIAGLSRVLVLDADFGEYGIPAYQDFETMARAVEGKGFFRASYTPYTYEMPVMFDLARVVGNCHLVLEEADRLEDPRSFLEYDEAISRGRHYGISLVGISLYPAKLPAMLRRQATRIIAFRQIEPRDIDYLAEIVGDAAYSLPDLAQFSYLDWTPGGGPTVQKLGGSKNDRLGKGNALPIKHTGAVDQGKGIEGKGNSGIRPSTQAVENDQGA